MNESDKIFDIVSKHIAKGNRKLPKTTWIFNSGSAKNCPSRELGLCQVGKDCYALKAERQYPQVLPYRERQFKITQEVSPIDFAIVLIKMREKCRNKYITFRFNESGDFYNQKQLDWFTSVCMYLKAAGIKCYGYTARTDLNLTNLLDMVSVMVSNDKGNWVNKGANRFKMFTKGQLPPEKICAGDCRICKMCLNFSGKVIGVPKH